MRGPYYCAEPSGLAGLRRLPQLARLDWAWADCAASLNAQGCVYDYSAPLQAGHARPLLLRGALGPGRFARVWGDQPRMQPNTPTTQDQPNTPKK